MGFSEDAILMMSFSGPIGIEPEAKVYVRNSSDVAMVGNSALGRVLDAAGLPIDGVIIFSDWKKFHSRVKL